jgi:DNA-directed RNA polymerase specialized sigma24 family protein
MMTEAAMTRTRLKPGERTTAYATGADFCRIFADDMKNLYLLALLLTADTAKAEQCFVSGLDDCAAGNQVFKEWARSWARRTIIRNALRLVAPEPPHANGGSNHAVSNRDQDTVGRQERPDLQTEVSALFGLHSFERFVFVMSVFEGYSDQDCALLLGCTRQTLTAARIRALQHIARSVDHGAKQADARSKAEPLHDNNSIVELTLPARLAIPA